jgi:hypothetical protein
VSLMMSIGFLPHNFLEGVHALDITILDQTISTKLRNHDLIVLLVHQINRLGLIDSVTAVSYIYIKHMPYAGS